MSGRTTLPLMVLVAMVVFELALLALGLVLVESGWRPAHTPVPVPMVSDVQLPDVPGDGS